jgi:serine/threonine protein kinase
LLHKAGFAHLDIKPENIMLNGEGLLLIDFDFLCSLSEQLNAPRGTPEYIPLEVIENFNNKVNPYQDIYGALVTAMLLLQPDIVNQFNANSKKLLNSIFSGRDYTGRMQTLQNFFITNAKQANDPFLNKAILEGLRNPKATALNMLDNILAADKDLAIYVAKRIAKDNQEQLQVLNAHIDLCYTKFPDFCDERRQALAQYFVRCLMQEEVVSLDKFIQELGDVHALETKALNYINKLLSDDSHLTVNKGLTYATRFLSKNSANTNNEIMLKAKTVDVLIQRLSAPMMLKTTISFAAFFLTAGDMEKVKEVESLYDQYEKIKGMRGHPEFMAACKAIETCLLEGLTGKKPYDHNDILNIQKSIDEKKRKGSPMASFRDSLFAKRAEQQREKAASPRGQASPRGEPSLNVVRVPTPTAQPTSPMGSAAFFPVAPITPAPVAPVPVVPIEQATQSTRPVSPAFQ